MASTVYCCYSSIPRTLIVPWPLAGVGRYNILQLDWLSLVHGP